MSHPDIQTLTEYWLGNVSDDALEEHLLDCAACSEQLGWVARLAKGIEAVVRGGNLAWIMTPEFLERLVAEGLRVRTYTPPLNGSVNCTVTPQDDLLMGRLRADLSDVARLDVVLTGGEGELRARLEDVAFCPSADGELVFNEPLDHARHTHKDVLKVRFVSVDAGRERVLGEYTFNHSVPAE